MIGPHIIIPTAAATTWAKAAPIVKSIDNTVVLGMAPAGAIKVFRHFTGDGDAQWQNTTPQAYLAGVVAALNGYYPTYIEGPNEAGYSSGSDLSNFIAYFNWQASYVAAAKVAGYTVAAFSWGTGWPTAAMWSYARANGWAGAKVICLHEYWGDQSFTIYNALRHRQFWQVGDPQIVIGETGRDKVEGGKGGWIADGLTGAQYIAELVAYNAEILKDTYVVGAVPFTAGPTLS